MSYIIYHISYIIHHISYIIYHISYHTVDPTVSSLVLQLTHENQLPRKGLLALRVLLWPFRHAMFATESLTCKYKLNF